MVGSNTWVALIDTRDDGGLLAGRFDASARILTRVLLEGQGYRRYPGLDPAVAGGPERYRTFVLEGDGWGVDTSLFQWSPRSRLFPLPKSLGVGLEYSVAAPGGPVLPWHRDAIGLTAVSGYGRWLEAGPQAIWAPLARHPLARRTVDDLCFWHRLPGVPTYVTTMLYSDDYVIDRRVGGPFMTEPGGFKKF